MTGGPGGGKTAVLELAALSFCEHVGILPEAAGVVFGGGFPRGQDPVILRAGQRAIFAIQTELENIVRGHARLAIALCDRGTLDGLAYWPDEPETYWAAVGSTRAAELQRYEAVIHLRTPAADQGYNWENPLRNESAAAAAVIDERIIEAWAGHPDRTIIEASEDFVEKMAAALHTIQTRLPACCAVHGLATEPRDA